MSLYTSHQRGVAGSLENQTFLLGQIPNSNNQLERLLPMEGEERVLGKILELIHPTWKPCCHLGILEKLIFSSWLLFAV
jgi:hypothetical protein